MRNIHIYLIIFIAYVIGTCSREAENPRQEKFEHARSKAIGFLDSIAPKINPITMRKEHGMKGKKHLVEYISTYLALYETADSANEKNLYRKKVEEVIAPVYTSEYHNLSNLSFAEFKEDVISYINACRILEKFGFDTKMYKEEIKKVFPLIISKEHLNRRGVDNNMAITFNLKALGFEGGYSYRELYHSSDCVIRTHLNLDSLDFNDPWQKAKVYDLTHEIFFLTNKGTTEVQYAKTSDLYYIKKIIPKLISICIKRKDPDLVAELLICLHYIGFKQVSQYTEAIDYLLGSQNPDGSWGNYDKEQGYVEKFRPRYLIDVGQYLHTVGVVLWALSLVFD